MLNNCSVSVRLINSLTAPTVKAAATVTIAEVGVIRDILIVETKRGVTAFGPSRKSTNPRDNSPYYQIVDLAPELRARVLERFEQVVADAVLRTARKTDLETA